jgi:hypothetical protein
MFHEVGMARLGSIPFLLQNIIYRYLVITHHLSLFSSANTIQFRPEFLAT